MCACAHFDAYTLLTYFLNVVHRIFFVMLAKFNHLDQHVVRHVWQRHILHFRTIVACCKGVVLGRGVRGYQTL
jgi:hypothetical protein